MTKSFFFDLPDDAERKALVALMDYCAALSRAYMRREPGFPELCDAFDLPGAARDSREHIENSEARCATIKTRHFNTLPCVEDVLQLALELAEEFDRWPGRQKQWCTHADLPGELMDILRDLHMVDHDGTWMEHSVPIQLRADLLIATGCSGCEAGNLYIEGEGMAAWASMPSEFRTLLQRAGSLYYRSVERIECLHYLNNHWRFGHWVGAEKAARLFGDLDDRLIFSILDQMLINQHNSYSHPDLE